VRAPQSAGGEPVRNDAEGQKALSSGTERARPNKDARSLAERRTRPSSTVAVFDGQIHVGDVIEHAGSGDFDAFTGTGKLIGTFPTQRAAVRAIPRARP